MARITSTSELDKVVAMDVTQERQPQERHVTRPVRELVAPLGGLGDADLAMLQRRSAQGE